MLILNIVMKLLNSTLFVDLSSAHACHVVSVQNTLRIACDEQSYHLQSKRRRFLVVSREYKSICEVIYGMLRKNKNTIKNNLIHIIWHL